ncbi:Uncharacterised protein [Clostridium fallax]|uniref:Uncharacterized protein n=1 Tax=Clostridium fallax TaxID=1533 RepID=A0A1M4Z0Y8_9CLOT|nr:hypothetical protein SAMN05443638_1359 [Clostridium fallax]SQB22207.1 Uncharacterised protein [Clostridium fallax]
MNIYLIIKYIKYINEMKRCIAIRKEKFIIYLFFTIGIIIRIYCSFYYDNRLDSIDRIIWYFIFFKILWDMLILFADKILTLKNIKSRFRYIDLYNKIFVLGLFFIIIGEFFRMYNSLYIYSIKVIYIVLGLIIFKFIFYIKRELKRI